MTERSDDRLGLSEALWDRCAALLGETLEASEPVATERVEFAAQLAAEWAASAATPCDLTPDGGERVARLAAWLDGDPDVQGIGLENGSAPQALEDALASLAFMERITKESGHAPDEWVEAAIAAWLRTRGEAASHAGIVPLRRNRPKPAAPVPAPMADTFLLLAAADGERGPAVVCRSQSGLWTLEVFVEASGEGEQSKEGYLLLSVHPDHRTTYEGRNARIYVVADDAERVLVDAPVRGGEVYAPISLAGLDLWSRDAINVVFTAVPDQR